MDARRVGVVLALAGLAVLAFAAEARFFPASFEPWACCDHPGAHLMAARGPALARYDAEADATYAVFECGHGHCDFAVRLRGDQTARVAAQSVLLRTDHMPPPRGTGPLAPPIDTPGGITPSTQVTRVTRETFDVVSPWPYVAMLSLPILLGVVGFTLAWGHTARVALVAALAAAAGLGLTLATAGTDNIIPYVLPLPLLVLALGFTLLGRAVPRLRLATPALLAATAALAWGFSVLRGFTAMDPLD